MQRNDFASIWPLPWTALSSALPTPADNENTIPHRMVEKQFARLSALGTLLWPIIPSDFQVQRELRISAPIKRLERFDRSPSSCRRRSASNPRRRNGLSSVGASRPWVDP